MLQAAIEEQGPKDEPGRIAKTEGIEFSRVKELRLDFRSKLIFNKLCKMKVNINIIYSICRYFEN